MPQNAAIFSTRYNSCLPKMWNFSPTHKTFCSLTPSDASRPKSRERERKSAVEGVWVCCARGFFCCSYGHPLNPFHPTINSQWMEIQLPQCVRVHVYSFSVCAGSSLINLRFSEWNFPLRFPCEVLHLRFPIWDFPVRFFANKSWDFPVGFSTENSLWDFHLRFSCEILHLRSSTWDPTVRFCTQDPRFPLRIPLRSPPWEFPWAISPLEISPEPSPLEISPEPSLPLRFPLPITAVSKQPFPAAACLPRRVVRRRHDATRAWRETFNH